MAKQTEPVAGAIQSSGDAAHGASGAAPGTLETDVALADIKHVLMHVDRRCRMGISWWPTMSFNSARPPQPASARVLLPGDPWLTPPAGDSAADATTPSGDDDAAAAAAATGGPLRGRAAAAAAVAAGRRLVLVDFTKDPPDEFAVGARFMCGLPFPFISIRTTRLAGVVDVDSGEVTLEFVSEFLAQSGNRKPTVLEVRCDLTTEATEVLGKTLRGERLRGGRCTLIAHALVPKTSSRLANLLLALPTAARAVLPMRLQFLPEGHPAAAAAAAEFAAAAAGTGPAAAATPAVAAAGDAAP